MDKELALKHMSTLYILHTRCFVFTHVDGNTDFRKIISVVSLYNSESKVVEDTANKMYIYVDNEIITKLGCDSVTWHNLVHCNFIRSLRM